MNLVPAFQVTTFITEDALEPLIEKVCEDFPLQYGSYKSLCWWSAPGVEQFVPLEGSSPTQGAIGKRERVSSVAVHFIIPNDQAQLTKLLENSIRPNHPWDEPVMIVKTVQVTAEIT